MTVIPGFTSEEYPYRLFEPLCIVVAFLVLERSSWVPWGGGVTFDRREIDAPLAFHPRIGSANHRHR